MHLRAIVLIVWCYALLCAAQLPDLGASADDLAEELVQQIKDAGDCNACQGVLLSLKGLATTGNNNFDLVLTKVCEISGAQDDDVCAGLIKQQGPLIAYQLRNVKIGSHTAQLLCTGILGLCPYPEVRPYTVKLPPPKRPLVRPKPSNKPPIYVGHISDTHVDLEYTTGANYNCTKPICCRPYTPEDAPGNTSYPAGPNGNPMCDPPLRLEDSMIQAMNQIRPNRAFTIQTGDVPAHDIWLIDRPEIANDLDTTYARFEKLGQVYPSVGNHEAFPVNAFPAKSLAIYNMVNPQWLYNNLARNWQRWLGQRAVTSTRDYGAYAAKYPKGKLRLIAFNSIFYYYLNFWMYEDPMPFDPSGQFQWLVSELQAAEDAGDRVWLFGHVPSGNADFFRDYSSYLDQIVQRYSATISAAFYGHTHVDSFSVAYSNYNAPSAKNAKLASYTAPSLTPDSGNPSFRIYAVDPDTFAIRDFTQYSADIKSPSFQTKPTWTSLYSAKRAYGGLLTPPLTDPKAELTPAFWHNVTELFERNDAAFQAYYRRKSRGYDTATCTGDCKTHEIKGLRASDANYNGVVPMPGLNIQKRDEDLCGEGKIRTIFQHLMAEHGKSV